MAKHYKKQARLTSSVWFFVITALICVSVFATGTLAYFVFSRSVNVNSIFFGEWGDPTDKFEIVFPNTDTYLYRVGNSNNAEIGYLFEALDGAEIDDTTVTVEIEKVDSSSDVSGTFTADTSDWTKGALQFSGTGSVKLTIRDGNYCNPISLYVEIVNGQNITSTSDMGGSTSATSDVLLTNITSTTFKSFEYSGNSALYGNGFTIQVSGTTSSDTGVVRLTNNAVMDNVVILAADHTDVYAMNSGNNPMFNSAVYIAGTDITISNSFIQGGRSAIRNRAANLTIDNSVINGGAFANLLVSSKGIITLNNVTTAQYITNDGSGKMGFGILFEETADGSVLNLNSSFKQYNWVSSSESSYFDYSYADYSSVINGLFTDYSNYTSNGKLNTGILAINGSITLNDNVSELNYINISKTVASLAANGYTANPTNSTVYHDYDSGSYRSTVQGPIKPAITYAFNSSSQYVAPGDGVTNYLYYGDDGVLHIGVSGTSTSFDALNGVSIDGRSTNSIAVAGDGFEGGQRTFTAEDKGNGIVTYSIIYDRFYNTDGTKSGKTMTFTYPLEYAIEVADWQDAVITVTPGTVYWNQTGSIVDYDYQACIPIAAGITVTDYAENGTSTTITSDGKSLPAGVTYTITKDGYPSFGNYTEVTRNDVLYYQTVGVSDNKRDTNYVLTFSYVGANGKTVTATATYTFTTTTENLPAESSGGGDSGGCLAPDALVTLADGTQKEVQYLKQGDELLVWNMFTGEYDVAPILFNDYEADDTYKVVNLTFSDGTVVRVIYEHGFYDVDLGKYIYLDENAQNYIGHRFDKSGKIVELVGVDIKQEYTTAWSPVTYGHLCYYVNGMLSMPGGIEGLFNYFEVDTETMRYDEAAMKADIEKYGLFTYEEFATQVPVNRVMFDALGGKYLKVAIGKGLVTIEELQTMAARYSVFFDE